MMTKALSSAQPVASSSDCPVRRHTPEQAKEQLANGVPLRRALATVGATYGNALGFAVTPRPGGRIIRRSRPNSMRAFRPHGETHPQLLHFLERDDYLSAAAIAKDFEVDLVPDLVTIQNPPQIINCMDGLAIHGSDHIPWLTGAPLRGATQTRAIRGTPRGDLPDHRTLRNKPPGNRVGYQCNTHPGANHLTKLYQLRNYFVDDIDGHGKPDA
jgi:hypothetical protein